MNPFRVDIVNLLNVIADFNAQIEYQEAVPRVGVPDELICQWFDDLYHPSAEIFINAFNEEEKDYLSKFNELFESYADGLPSEIEHLHKTKEWLELSDYAKEILTAMGLFGKELRYETQG
jgi:hypothetical protein